MVRKEYCPEGGPVRAKAASIFAALVLAAGVAGLSPSESAAQPTGKPEVSELLVGILPITGHVPAFAAQELGYLAQEGLKITIQFGAGAQVLPLIIQGQMQIGSIPHSTGLQARAKNFDVLMIGVASYVEKSRLPGHTATMVRADGKINKVSDLAGKKIAVNVINSVNWLYNRAMLDKYGVDLKSVQYTELPFPSMIDALVNGHVDAAALVQPFVYFGEQGKKVKVLAYDFIELQPGLLVSGFAVTRKWATAHPRTLAAFERAIARAVDYLVKNEAQAIQLAAKYTKTKPEIIQGAGMTSWTNEISLSNLQQQMELMVKHGMLDKPQNVRDMIWPTTKIVK